MKFRMIGRCVTFLLILMLAAVGFSQQLSVTGITFSPATIAGGGQATGTVTLSGPVSVESSVSVSLTSANSSVTVPIVATVNNGSSTGTFTASAAATGSNYSSLITATLNGGSVSTTLKVVTNGIASVTLNTSAITAGDTATGTVTLLAAAPSGGWKVSLTDSNSNDSIPSSVTVAAGKTSTTFTVSTTTKPSSSYSDTFVATDVNTSQSVGLTVYAEGISSITLPATYLKGGSTMTATLNMKAPAPVGGWTVTLTSSNANYATVPATVTVPYLQHTATFSVTAVAGAEGDVTLGATDQNSKTSTVLDVLASTGIKSVVVTPTIITSGAQATITVNFLYPVPTGGYTVKLSNTSAKDPIPSTLTAAAGATNVQYVLNTVNTNAKYTDTITASDSATTASATLTVYNEWVSSLTFAPSTLQGGNGTTGTITLLQPAPQSGWTVNLTSNSSYAQVPSSITVPYGSKTATFSVTTTLPGANTSALITAQDVWAKATSTISIQGPFANGVVLTPSTINQSQTSSGTITLNVAAPTGGDVIPLTSSSTNVAVPASVTIAAGSTTATFPVTPVANVPVGTYTITATINGSSASGTLTVRASHVNWKYLVGNGDSVTSKAAVSNLGLIEVGATTSTGGIFDALNPTGTLSWYDGPYTAAATSPAIASNGNVYIAVGQTVYAYSPKGVLLWSVVPSTGNALTTSVTLSGSNLYVGCADGSVYAVSTGGSVSWKYATAGVVNGQPAVDSSGNVYFAGTDSKVYALTSGGSPLWSHTLGGPTKAAPAVSGGTVYIGAEDDKMYAVTSAGIQWSYATAGQIFSTPTVGSDGTIYFGSNDKNFYALNSNGTFKWNFTTGGTVTAGSAISSTGTIYFGSMDGNVYALNASGNEVWFQPVTSLGVQGTPVIDTNGYVDLGSNDGYFTSFKP